jgi:threonine/homoserine/homoserine lactone efflux protein
LLLGAISLPFGLVIVLGHNICVWGLPLIVTVLGWLITLKCTIYLLVPWAHRRAMPNSQRMERGLRLVGGLIVFLGALAGYDAFFCR